MPRDFAGIAAHALHQARDLVPRWLPDGRAEGNEWKALNPTRPDSHLGSFSVNLHTGAWGDFAGGDRDRGGDLISLHAYIHGTNQAQACDAVAREMGLEPGPKTAPTAPAARPSPARTDDDLVVPVPADAPDWMPLMQHPAMGKATGAWPYRDARGQLLMVVIRWDPTDGKTFRPYTLRRDGTRLTWKPKGLPDPRPLYRLDEIARYPEATVIVCEGEKAADAAQRLLPPPLWVTTTSPNGAKNAGHADWTTLAGRRVVLWPDADEPGAAYAETVSRALVRVRAKSVSVVELESVGMIRDRVMGASS